MEKQLIYVEGMTCSGCERTVERAVSQLKGVRYARADHQKGYLEVEFSAPCTRVQICAAIEKAGYAVTEKPRRRSDSLYLLIILLGLYVIARQLGWTEVFRAFPTVSSRQMGYIALFLTGLMTSVHCIAMCGGLNLAQSMGMGNAHPIRGSLLYNLGRLASYTLIGGILGFIGEKAAITLQVRGLIGLGAGILMLFIDDMTISCRTHCICPPGTARKCTQRRQVPGSNAFVPSVVGLIIAGEVIKDMSGFGNGVSSGKERYNDQQ